LVHAIKRDKIRIEILKAMECQNASAFWGALLFTGVLNIILPELQDCWLHVGGKHHLESVWEHTMLVGDSISTKFPLVKLAGYLHDIGKPEAWKRVLGDGFDNHHEIGADILDIRLKQLRFSNEEINIVSGLTRHHMRMVLKSTSKSSRKTLQKLHECECSWKDLVRIRIADNKSNISKSPYNPSDIKKMVASFDLDEDVPFTVKELDVSGLDLINEWELPRNRVVSDLQKHLLEFVLSGGDNNADCLLLESKNFLDAKEK
jgi:putative nucleotidyltransferase with HDIG domain